MAWLQTVLAWAKEIFDSVGLSPVAFPLAFLLGLVSAVASACCALPVVGAVIGYSGARQQSGRGRSLLTACFFMLGSTLAILILGVVAGFVGQLAQLSLGKYWKLFAGLIAIVFGLATLDLLPLKIARKKVDGDKQSRGLLGDVFFGLIMGGAVSVFSLGCNPGIFIILGVAVLQGYTAWMAGVLVSFAIGFSLPLAVLVLGVSFGRSALGARRAERGMRIVAGLLLIGAGFYFLATF